MRRNEREVWVSNYTYRDGQTLQVNLLLLELRTIAMINSMKNEYMYSTHCVELEKRKNTDFFNENEENLPST